MKSFWLLPHIYLLYIFKLTKLYLRYKNSFIKFPLFSFSNSFIFFDQTLFTKEKIDAKCVSFKCKYLCNSHQKIR